MRLRRVVEEFLTSEDRQHVWMRVVAFVLLPCAYLYAKGQQARVELYRHGILRTRELGCPVISIGNLTVGGSGKTPFTIWLAQRCIESSMRVLVLTRGYGRAVRQGSILRTDEDEGWQDTDRYGDEPVLIASSLGVVTVGVGRDRYATGRMALARYGADIVLLDDGFQHLRLSRTVDIVLVPSIETLQRSAVLPAGMLREPLSALRRAHYIVTTSLSPCSISGPVADDVMTWYRQFNPSARIFHALFYVEGIYDVFTGTVCNLEDLKHKRIVAFCGIGRPSRFFQTLFQLGLIPYQRATFPDHHRYSASDIAVLQEWMTSVDYAITTEKDAVKLRRYEPFRGRLLAVHLSLQLSQEQEFWDSLCASISCASVGNG